MWCQVNRCRVNGFGKKIWVKSLLGKWSVGQLDLGNWPWTILQVPWFVVIINIIIHFQNNTTNTILQRPPFFLPANFWHLYPGWALTGKFQYALALSVAPWERCTGLGGALQRQRLFVLWELATTDMYWCHLAGGCWDATARHLPCAGIPVT